MSVHIAPRECRLSEFASSIGVRPQDLWLPLWAFAGPRSRPTTPIRISDSTPIVLRHEESGNLLCDRRETLLHLNFFNINDVSALSLRPSDIPKEYELFVRWDKPTGNKLIPSTTPVLHRPLTEGMATAEGSAITISAGRRSHTSKRTPSSANDTVDHSSLAQILKEGSEQSSMHNRAAEDLAQRLHQVLGERGLAGGGQSQVIMDHIRKKIMQTHSDSPPLHFILEATDTKDVSKGSSFPRANALPSIQTADGFYWWRPDPRILYRVFRSTASSERAETSQHSDASRELAIFFINDVVFPTRLQDSLKTVQDFDPAIRKRVREDNNAALSETGTASPLERGHTSTETHLAAIAKKMKAYADRGYRVLLLDHYPYLHHGNAAYLEKTLHPISDFCTKYFSAADGGEKACTITVVLSVMSYITAHQRHSRTEASFVIPNTGILSYFVAHLNASLMPDTITSFVVGSRDRSTPLLNGFHKTFADAASLKYVEVASLLSE